MCRGYKSGNSAFVAFVASIDMLMVRSNVSARSREEGTQGAVAILREKRVKVVYLETQIEWILFYGKLENEIERFGGTHPEILRMHLVRIKFRERKGQSGGIIQKKVNLMSEILARPVFEEQHLRIPHGKHIVTAKQRGTWREKKYNAEQEGDLSSDKKGHFEKVQRP